MKKRSINKASLHYKNIYICIYIYIYIQTRDTFIVVKRINGDSLNTRERTLLVNTANKTNQLAKTGDDARTMNDTTTIQLNMIYPIVSMSGIRQSPMTSIATIYT